MKKMKKILVPVDFSSNADQALDFAALLANEYESEITLLHAVTLFHDDPNNPVYQFPDTEKIVEKTMESVGDNLNGMVDKLETLQVKTKTVRSISPAEAIIDFAEDGEFDLIVMGTHGRTGFKRFLMGSVAERVIRHAPCPVITVKLRKDEASFTPALNKIIVGVDFSNYSKLALAHAADFARRFNASLQVLHVVEEQIHPSFYVTGSTTIFDVQSDLREKSAQALKDFVDETLIEPIDYACHIREGRAHIEIVKFAEEQNADLIVLATHGLGGLDHFLIGSNSEKVAKQAKAPVFILLAKGVNKVSKKDA